MNTLAMISSQRYQKYKDIKYIKAKDNFFAFPNLCGGICGVRQSAVG